MRIGKVANITVLTACLAIVPSPRSEAQQASANITSNGADECNSAISLAEQNCSSDKARATQQQPPKWYASAEWSNWALVFVALVTAGVIGWQSNETKRAANAAFQSIKLQESQMEQWVDLGNWRANYRHLEADVRQLRITFDIINPTSYPLRLKNAVVTFADLVNDKVRFAQDLGTEVFISPKIPYSVDAWFLITPEEADTYLGDSLNFIVRGTIPHAGVLQREAIQQFEGILSCGKRVVVFDFLVPMTPKQKT